MSEELKRCPHCGKTDTLEFTDCIEAEGCQNYECFHMEPYVCVVCNVNKGGCGASGGYAPSEEEAVEKWNRRAQSSEPTKPVPLTLDELRKMDGEPVWIEQNGVFYPSGYGIVDCWPDGRITVQTLKGCFYSVDYVKAWEAYRRKPEAHNAD